MKRIAALLCIVIGCRTAPGSSPASTGSGSMGVGAASPSAAVDQLLMAAKLQDLQAISAVFGDETGLARDHNSRDVTEERSFIMSCVLRSDTYKLGEPTRAENSRMYVMADMTQGKSAGSIQFEVAKTPGGRWLVAKFDMSVLQNKGFCSRP